MAQMTKNSSSYLIQVTHEWSQLACGHLQPDAADNCLCQVIYQKIASPLVATTFTAEQCNSITKPLLVAGLAAAGFTGTFPRAVMHWPLQLHGLNFPNLHSKQTLSHVMMLLKYGQDKMDTTEILLWAMCKAMRLKAGCKFSDVPVILQDVITDSWIKMAWMNNHSSRISIIVTSTNSTFHKKVAWNSFRYLSHLGQWGLWILNCCRMELRVIYIHSKNCHDRCMEWSGA